MNDGSLYHRPPSLKITEELLDAYVEDNPVARAAIDAWKFSYPIRFVTPQEFEEITARGRFIL
jgi:hypothetical protein